MHQSYFDGMRSTYTGCFHVLDVVHANETTEQVLPSEAQLSTGLVSMAVIPALITHWVKLAILWSPDLQNSALSKSHCNAMERRGMNADWQIFILSHSISQLWFNMELTVASCCSLRRKTFTVSSLFGKLRVCVCTHHSWSHRCPAGSHGLCHTPQWSWSRSQPLIYSTVSHLRHSLPCYHHSGL